MTDIESVIRKATSPNADIAERQHAFGELVQRFQDMAYGYAYAILGDYGLAEDAAQETFLAAYQILKQLRNPKAFPGWLKRIVLTQYHRIVRRNGAPTEPIEAAWELPSTAPNPIEKVLRQEQTDLVNAAILGLPEDERMVTTL